MVFEWLLGEVCTGRDRSLVRSVLWIPAGSRRVACRVGNLGTGRPSIVG